MASALDNKAKRECIEFLERDMNKENEKIGEATKRAFEDGYALMHTTKDTRKKNIYNIGWLLVYYGESEQE